VSPVAGAAGLEVFAAPRVTAQRRDDGTLLLRSAVPLEEHAPSVVHRFREHAEAQPEATLVAFRGGDGWRTLSWQECRARADAVAQALLDRGLGPDRPLLVLSGNSVEHLLMALGAFTAGVPVVPISAAYSLVSRDHGRLRAIAELCTPGMVFADDADAFERALDVVSGGAAHQTVVRGARPSAERFDDLAQTTPTREVEGALAGVGPDTVAKILFTSGSTGTPKGVINTQRMMSSNQQALGQIWPFLHAEPPVLVDWLPWSHTFGGNHNLNQVLWHGGTLYIDDGKPTPELFERTIGALREIAPTIYYNVPAGWAHLAPRLEADRDLAGTFFSRLRIMFYAGAALPEPLWRRLTALADAVADHRVALTSSWGTTETAPAVTAAHFASAPSGCVGVPLPGVTLKLVSNEGKLEARAAGPNITPAYFRNPEATQAAFDEEGFYRTGDALRPVDPDHLNRGLIFDGRLAEEFKLGTGTWVAVGRLRLALISAAGVLSDAVIAGHERDYAAALAWLNHDEARLVCGLQGEGTVPLDHPGLRDQLAGALEKLNAGAGSAARIERLLLLDEPPSIDAGEITDKGYINQRAVLERRSELVDRLFADPPVADLILAATPVRP
jgi:feruloyl-CoA synthase